VDRAADGNEGIYKIEKNSQFCSLCIFHKKVDIFLVKVFAALNPDSVFLVLQLYCNMELYREKLNVIVLLTVHQFHTNPGAAN
jgi:hypothetical protein